MMVMSATLITQCYAQYVMRNANLGITLTILHFVSYLITKDQAEALKPRRCCWTIQISSRFEYLIM